MPTSISISSWRVIPYSDGKAGIFWERSVGYGKLQPFIPPLRCEPLIKSCAVAKSTYLLSVRNGLCAVCTGTVRGFDPAHTWTVTYRSDVPLEGVSKCDKYMGKGVSSRYLRLDPTCRRLGLLSNVDCFTGDSSPSRLILSAALAFSRSTASFFVFLINRHTCGC